VSSWEAQKLDAASLTLVNLYFTLVNVGLNEGRLLKADVLHVKFQLSNHECRN